MVANIHIPYGFGDCVNGFRYDGQISEKEYARKMVEEYNKHKDGIDDMMISSFRHNIARNHFQKENNKYKQQEQEFGELLCYVDDKTYSDMKMEELLRYFENDESFVMVIRLYNVKQLINDQDLYYDIKSWQKETVGIDRLPHLDDVTKFKSLSKKDLKLTFGDSKMAAILKDCKMVNVYSNTKFALWVSKIIFINDRKESNGTRK